MYRYTEGNGNLLDEQHASSVVRRRAPARFRPHQKFRGEPCSVCTPQILQHSRRVRRRQRAVSHVDGGRRASRKWSGRNDSRRAPPPLSPPPPPSLRDRRGGMTRASCPRRRGVGESSAGYRYAVPRSCCVTLHGLSVFFFFFLGQNGERKKKKYRSREWVGDDEK